MRILITVGENPNTLGSCYARGITNAGHDIRGMTFSENQGTTWSSQVLRRLSPEHAFSKINAQIEAEVASFRPSVLWIFKGMEIYPKTLRQLRAQGIFLINYNADHPFKHFSTGSGNSNVLSGIPEYHLHLTYSQTIACELRQRYPGIKVAVIPFGHDVAEDQFTRISAQDEIVRACFLGNPDQHRRRNIQRLVDVGIAVDVYGGGWERYLKPTPLLSLNGPAVGEEMLRVLRRYRVQLNFFRPHNIDSHNMRTFEVPASGGIMLAEDSGEHRSFFDIGREAFFFARPKEMIDLTQQLLALSSTEADTIRAAARRRSVVSGYSYQHRALAALAEIEKSMETR